MEITINYEQVLAKYWELANLTADATKGSITGQLKALELLCEELRRVPGETAKPEIYPSAWMGKR